MPTPGNELQHALMFLQAVREDAALRGLLAEGQDGLAPEALMALGAARGWHFGSEALALAFRHDWTLRRLGSARP